MQTDYISANCQEIRALTGLRFFAAALVCLTHVIPKIAPGSLDFFGQLGPVGMTLFFVLSGFVIHYNYSATIYKAPTTGIYNFLVARFARVYPLFIVCIFFDISHLYGYSMLGDHFQKTMSYYLTLTQAWVYVPLNKNALIYQFGLMSQVSWSVSTEWFFYLMYPFICFFISKIRTIKGILMVLTIIGILMSLLIMLSYFKENYIEHYVIHHYSHFSDAQGLGQDSFYRWLLYFSPYSRISDFFIGCLTASIFMRLSSIQPSQRENNVGSLVLVATIIGLFIAHHVIYNPPKMLPWVSRFQYSFGFTPFIAIIMFCVARYKNFVCKFLANSWIVLGGEISYSIYFLHLPIASAFSRDAAQITSWQVCYADISRLIIALTAILGASFITYVAIEKPLRNLIRKHLRIGPEITSLNNQGESLRDFKLT